MAGWATTSWFVERRYAQHSPDEGGAAPAASRESQRLEPRELRGLAAAGLTLAVILAALMVMVILPRGPLYGQGAEYARWVHAIVPILFITFLFPGVAYGLAARTVRSHRDVAVMMAQTMKDMAPYIVLAFFAAQFIAYFHHSNLGQMLAQTGGRALAAANLSPELLLASFIGLVMIANFFMGSASAKYAFFAPVFVPMFMAGAQFSPELTQVAYRVGDSVTNIVTPLNPYLIIILVFMQRYAPRSGIGTLVALMLPYTITFAILWTLMLVLWVQFDWPLGPAGPLFYTASLPS